MSDLAAYLGAAVLLAWAGSRSALERRESRRPIRRAGLTFALCEGCSLALLAPHTVSALTRAGLPGPAVVAAGDAVRTLAISYLMLLACALNPRRRRLRPGRTHRPDRPGHPDLPDRPDRPDLPYRPDRPDHPDRPDLPDRPDQPDQPDRPDRPWTQLTVAVLIQAAQLALFLAARPRLDAHGQLCADAPGRWPLALRVALFAGYAVWALVELFLALLPQARLAATRPLRWGVRLILAATCVGMLWSLWSYDDFIDVLRHGDLNGSEDVVSNVLGALCATLVVGGALLGRSGSTYAATARWLRLYRCYRLLGPLWSAMRTAMPYIAFPQAARPRLASRLRLEFALYRRVIEIHDGRLVLRPYHQPEVASWVAAAGGSEPSDALLEAATLATALENMRRERRFADVPETPAGDPGLVLTDLDSEVLWLSRVAWAFSRSPLIPLVLERMRDEAN